MPIEMTSRIPDLALPPLEPWPCPACAQINTGEIAAGCASCGSGAAQARKAPAPLRDPREPRVVPAPALVDEIPVAVLACDAWLAKLPDADRLPPSVRAWVVDAFHAGWQAAQRQEIDRMSAEPLPVPHVSAVDLPFPVEGKVARTLAVALRLFLDNTLVAADEEIAAGEWCSVAEAEALIARLEAEGMNPYHG